MPIRRTMVGNLLLCLMLGIIVASGCGEPTEPEPTLTRQEAIPADAIKMLPETDSYPCSHGGKFRRDDEGRQGHSMLCPYGVQSQTIHMLCSYGTTSRRR